MIDNFSFFIRQHPYLSSGFLLSNSINNGSIFFLVLSCVLYFCLQFQDTKFLSLKLGLPTLFQMSISLLELATGIETTLFSRDTEAFALEPVEVTIGKEKKKKRKRKLIVDDIKIISSEKMKKQIESTADIVKPAVVAPPTKWRYMLLLFLFIRMWVFERSLD